MAKRTNYRQEKRQKELEREKKKEEKKERKTTRKQLVDEQLPGNKQILDIAPAEH